MEEMIVAKKHKILSLVTAAVITGSGVVTTPGLTAYANEPAATDEKQEVQAPQVQMTDLKVSQSTVGTVTMANTPDLVITELVPNGGNATSPITGSAYDAYEFVEIYNNSNQPIDLADYQLLYQYPKSNQLNDLDWSVQESRILQPGKTLVVWLKSQIHDKGLTIADFNKYYKTNLTEQDIAIVPTAGIDNTNERTLTIKDKNFTVISSAHIPQGSKTNNKSINYTVVANASNLSLLENAATPTPGSVENNQLPEIDYDYVKPPQTAKIDHTPVTTTTRTSTMKVAASLDSEDKKASDFKLYYRPLSDGVWQELDMDDDNGDGVYDGYIPYSLFVTDTFQYKIIAQVEGGNVSTEEYTVDVSDIMFDAQQVPALLITEMMPSSVSHNSRNVFEFVEVYNNSTQPISMKDYDLKYTNNVWVPDETNKVLNPGETVVYWIMNDVNRGYTVEDFNKQYGTDLTEDQIIRVTGSFANDSSQTLSIISKTGEVISSARYYDQNTAFGIKDVSSGFSVHYAYPQNGSTNMIKYSYLKANRTPGKVDAIQVPEEKVNLTDNTNVPILNDLTAKGRVSTSEDLTILFEATDDTSIKKAQLFYKFKGEDTYRTEVLSAKGENLYAHTLDYVELIGKEQIEYYVSVSDGTNVVESKVKKIKIQPDTPKTTGFNIDNRSVVSGKVNLKMFNGNGTLTINGKPITNTAKSLAGDSYFVFEATGMDNYFQNAVTVGEDVLAIYDASVQTYKLLSATVDASYVGDPFKISVRTGTRFDVFNPESTLNRDDFRIKNIRLVLPDGTVLTDPNYAVKDEELKVGDSSGMQEVFDFQFDIPEEALTASAYEWDTTTLADGEYKISDGKRTIKVAVDNTAPEIQSLIEDQKTYSGNFTIDADVTDASAITEVKATLDGKEIKLPFATNSSDLKIGEHTVVYTATDSAGNESSKTVTFHTTESTISLGGASAVVDGMNAELKVGVTDPEGDLLDVTFFEGYRYTPGSDDKNIQVYEDTSLTEPPADLSKVTDTLIESSKEDAISAVDDQYLSISSTEEYPYHRFQVEVDENVDEKDEVKINWVGKSLEGRKVSMYVWNFRTGEWNLQTWHVAENDRDFELEAAVLANADYVKDNKMEVVIQDEIAASTDYDYSFVWMTDTQYYSESYPEIFDSMTKWIVDSREALNTQYVFHTGDIVDEMDKQYQWENADKYLSTLEKAGIPYGVLAGNHDVNFGAEDYATYSQYFGADRYKDQSYYGGSYKDNRGHYDVLNIKGTEFLMLYMGWGVDAEAMAWMNEVIAAHPDSIVFLNFHEYVNASGQRTDIGNLVYENVVIPNKNVVAVLSGHIHDSETLVDEIDDDGDGVADRKVYQMLADYQASALGGIGYLRILKVNQANGTMSMETYSPYLDDYNYYDEDEYPGKDSFTMEIDFGGSTKEKVIETNAFSIDVLTNREIGKDRKVASGSEASAKWRRLEANTEYGWYAKVEESGNGDKITTDLNLFTTGNTKKAGKGN